METLLLIFAILASVILLLRYATPKIRPKFKVGKRLPQSMLISRMKLLGRCCAVTERGFGVQYRNIKFKGVISDIENKYMRGQTLDDWEAEFYIARDSFLNALDRSKAVMRKSYMLGHVNGLPRLFLLCNDIVANTRGNISEKALNEAVNAFEEYAPFDKREREVFPDMLVFCLCGLLHRITVNAEKHAAGYTRGIADGKRGNVNLEQITCGDYVCGLCAAAPSTEICSIERLLECNGISRESVERGRCKFLAETCAVIEDIEQVIVMADRFRQKKATANALLESRLSSRTIGFLNIAPLVLISVVAVLFCVFATARYAAVFVVLSILIYIVFRLPTLIYAPSFYGIDLSRISEKLKNKLIKKKTISFVAHRKQADAAFFGGESEYLSHDISGGSVVSTDNRGRVTVKSKRFVDLSPIELKMICTTPNGSKVNLSSCDGAFVRHKSVYRTVSDDTEISAELLAPVNCDGCCCKVNLVNRDKSIKEIEVAAICIPRENRTHISTDTEYCGVACIDGVGRTFALAFDKPALYGGNLYEYLNNGRLITDDGAPAAIGVCKLTLDGFSQTSAYIGIVYGASVREAARALEYVNSDGYFDLSERLSRVYCGLTDTAKLNTVLYTNMNNAVKKAKTTYSHLSLPTVDTEIKLDCGGFRSSGEFTPILNTCDLYNFLHDENFDVKLSQRAICTVGKLLGNGADELFDLPKINIVLGENGVLWSPTAKPLGQGDMSVVYGFTHTEYKCSYNGCLATLKIFLARGKSAVIFDLTVENTVNKSRAIDIMFSALADKNRGDKNFIVLSSDPIRENTRYKEGYFVYGKIDRVNGFRQGGSTLAPTVSVRSELKPAAMTRAVFCLTDNDQIKEIDIPTADAYFKNEVEYYKRFWKIGLRSDDSRLNIMYKRALYQANIGGLDGLSMRDKLIVLSALKYVNVKAVRKNIISLFSEQNENGIIGYDVYNGLYLAFAVQGYAEFTRDFGIFDEYAEYKPRRVHGRMQTSGDSVAEHCFKAIDIAVSEPCRSDNLAANICYDKMLIDVLRYYIELCRKDEARRKHYFYALGMVATRYAQNTELIKPCNYFMATSAESALINSLALFYADEYDKAYKILRYVNPIDSFARDKSQLPHWFGSSVVAALYYTVITEQLLGLGFRGKAVRIAPKIAANAPQLRFELDVNGGSANVIIDGKEQYGDWRMRVDKISYSKDSVDIGKYNGAEIEFFRSG